MDRSDTSSFVSGGCSSFLDLNNNPEAFSFKDELNKNDQFDDTTLRLDCYGYGGTSDISQENSRGKSSKSRLNDGARLVLGLGPTSSIYSSEPDSVLKLSLSQSHHSSTSRSVSIEVSNRFEIPGLDEGSTSAKFSGGYMPSLLFAPRLSAAPQKRILSEPEVPSVVSDYQTSTKRCEFSGFGGTRCSHPTGCSKAARGKSGLCIKHGGGKRCVVESCTRSAEGKVGLCISHGGGRRCQFQGCRKGAQGSTMFCKTHGGGKRCVFTGCPKGAEGSTLLCKFHGGGKRCLYEGGGICPKSVHGGTDFCVAHGGGKRCAVSGCTKSARGQTNCCVKHGGGKRCSFENCSKSAQGSTDFCKAHGGGKRCVWDGEGKCEKLSRTRGGLCVAHGHMVQENQQKKNIFLGIAPQLFNGLVSGSGPDSSDNHSLSCTSVVSSFTSCLEKMGKIQQMIPSQVLVPSSMKSSSFSSFTRQISSETDNHGGRKTLELEIPEGRVHGGSLLSLLNGNVRDAVIDRI